MNKLKPSQILFFSFILIIFIGTILLLLPISRGSEGNLKFFEALFTATSSLSVTGLSVVNISQAYSRFGQTIILVLIQLGGLGVMTFSSVFMLLIGRRIKYHEKKILMENLNRDSLDNIVDFIVKLIKIVFLIEFIGAIFLLIRFKQDMALLDAIFYSIFHSISAFCNAGISIFPDNLLSYSDSIIINFTISSLIIIGGIGFAVIYSFIDKIKDRKKESTLTTKVAVRITIWLLVIGFFVIIITEYNNPETIGTMSFFDKIMASFFQSATVRTAGFYTISVDKLMPGTRYLFYLFMFIGASPGSTGGGVKTTTFGVIIYSIIAIIRNKKDVTIINRRISWHIINRALAILIISISYVSIITFAILIFEERDLIDIIFETMGAFSTVGFSTGITPTLHDFSKILLMLTMIIGRLGPLTFAIALGEELKVAKYRYPRENILIG